MTLLTLLKRNLHSIMYLLIQEQQQEEESEKVDLHSIMYLLILKLGVNVPCQEMLFTFHNVSINSKYFPFICTSCGIYIP